ncbi:MAG: NUDIX hydrolase [Halieaceae bacterium]|jgi:ADP-ribose pyrophosphatase YjhB (NUDIX family)|nr:NUDIX hydrolase [Halieaceae bacterium]
MKFCTQCGGALALTIPAGDDRERHVCTQCGHIHYQNPRIIVGCLPTHEDRVLLCRRAIEPRYGKWTLPAGFMENGETTAEGAARETWEEAEAKATHMTLYRVFDVPQIHQVYVFYRCGVEDGRYGAGPESLETALFDEADIPWDQLAFPVVSELLTEFFEDRVCGDYPVRHSVVYRPASR